MRRINGIMYKDLRKERVEIFEETKHLYCTNKRLVDSINYSKQNQKVIAEGVQIAAPIDKYNVPANVVVSRKRSLAAAGQYSVRNVCVLNFASATNAGGGVAKGSNAQEEAICRCSTLYPCISDSRVVSQFHDKHRRDLISGQINALYNDDCIYTPKVTVFSNDTDTPMLLPENLWYEVDVISCAAPNLRSKPSNAMNPNSGSKAVTIKPTELLELHKKRMCRILDIARANGAEVIILGAFGCGAFKNPPDVVARAMKEIVKKYLYSFETIEFAVYCPPRDTKNYDVFNRTLQGEINGRIDRPLSRC